MGGSHPQMPNTCALGSVVGGRLGLEEMREQRNNVNKDPLKGGHRVERPRHSLALCRPQ